MCRPDSRGVTRAASRNDSSGTVGKRVSRWDPGAEESWEFPESSLTAGGATREVLGLHHLDRGPFGTISPDARENTEVRYPFLPADCDGRGCVCVCERARASMEICVWVGEAILVSCESLNECVYVRVCAEPPCEHARN